MAKKLGEFISENPEYYLSLRNLSPNRFESNYKESWNLEIESCTENRNLFITLKKSLECSVPQNRKPWWRGLKLTPHPHKSVYAGCSVYHAYIWINGRHGNLIQNKYPIFYLIFEGGLPSNLYDLLTPPVSEGTRTLPAGIDIETINGYECESCSSSFLKEDANDSPLYECGNCGTVFNKSNSPYGSHRCECGKFASKISPVSCNECNSGPIHEALLVQNEEGELKTVEKYLEET